MILRQTTGIGKRVQCGYCGTTKRGRVSYSGFPPEPVGPAGCCDASTRLPADSLFASRNKGRLPGWKPLRAVAAPAPAPTPDPLPPAPAPARTKRRARKATPKNGSALTAKWQKVLDAFASGNPNKVAGTLYRYNTARVAAGQPKMTVQEARDVAA